MSGISFPKSIDQRRAVTRANNTSRRQRGQVLPTAAFGVLIAAAVLVLMFNNSQKVTEKSLVANAADAAAYSAGVWTARHLNYMAYTNRAMVANHVAVGHYISYISWFRYIEWSIDSLQDFTSWVPYWGAFITAAERVVEIVSQANDIAAQVLVPAMDGLNSLYRASQFETSASLIYGGAAGLDRIMEETAHTYDNSITVNDSSELRALPGLFSAPLIAKVQYQRVELPRMVERYTAGRDSGRIGQLITNTIRADNDNRRWIEGNRGWNLTVPFIVRFTKQGSTRHSQDGNGADWEAGDRAQYRTWRGIREWSRPRNIGPRLGEASATEFSSNYSGVPNYYNVRGNIRDDHSLDIAAVAAKRQNAVLTKNLLRMNATAQPLMIVALARVEFSRPGAGLDFPTHGRNRAEYANLFNPFWEARLAAIDIPGI